jgi:hypothetical protein
MATLKSKKMVRGRDLKTPLAASTMDKAKGGPGDGKKKSTKKPKKYTGKPSMQTKVIRPDGSHAYMKKGQFEKMKGYDEVMRKKTYTKKTRGDGTTIYTHKDSKKN